ncbi:hypothetical protein ACIQMR_37700 [Streptomyces sp. NPDC091376]|uniref:hypothetical protein n=1 Tax=Streptomyces sp. NPDC091376 TaxID=3365994 RepID=UPI00380E9AAB
MTAAETSKPRSVPRCDCGFFGACGESAPAGLTLAMKNVAARQTLIPHTVRFLEFINFRILSSLELLYRGGSNLACSHRGSTWAIMAIKGPE